MMQAFALDDIYCPSGFFTAKYSVIDITEYLDILFRCVDVTCVSMCTDTVRKTILPHSLQLISMLDAQTADQRCAVTADEAVGPLAMLFEFGELDRAVPLDPSMTPVLLFGTDSELLGDASALARRKWQSTTAGTNVHAVVEGCEPATGIRCVP